MYEVVADTEVTLHWFIRQSLYFLFEDNWWRDGVPEAVRKDCRNAQEGDPEQVNDPFCYTTFIHLKQILDKHWGRLQNILPPEVWADKGALLARLVRLNQIRNQVMHPVKLRSPTEDDFVFVQDCFGYFRFQDWKVFRSEAATAER